MNFFPFHIGDYMAHTAHLEPMEDLAYRRMIDLYYIRESCLPLDAAEVAKLIRMRSEIDVVKSVLQEFFKETAEGWTHSRCEYELCELQSKRMKAKESAAKRWNSEGNANAMPTHSEGDATNTNTNTNTKEEPKNISGYPPEFEEFWTEYPSRPGASKKDALKAWNARIKSGVEVSVMLNGCFRYSAFCKTTGTEPQYVKQPATFLGPGEHYLSDWTPPLSRASPVQSINDKRANTIAELTGANRNDRTNERDITGEAFRVA